METPRHQCIIYGGSPAQYLPRLATAIKEKLSDNIRCLYLNSPPMVTGMRSYLSAIGVDVAHETEKGSLVLSSDQGRPAHGAFEARHMLKLLEAAVTQALKEGYAGLWATGDMAWECGGENDHMKVLEYEWGLEELFRKQSALSGVCQYHLDTLPSEVSRQALIAHKAIFVNETLSRLNPYYLPPECFDGKMPLLSELKDALAVFSQAPASEKLAS